MNDAAEVRRVTRIPVLPPRPPASHKGTFGRVLIVAGSRGMSGAACLVGTAALRGGAGLVRVAAPKGISASVAAYEPSYLTWPLPEDRAGRLDAAALSDLLELAQENDVLGVGPGLGQSAAITQTLAELIGSVAKPTVLDADGLSALGGSPDRLALLGAHVVITPHPGEFARLLGTDTATVQAHREQMAIEFSRRHHTVTVLKGHQTVVTDGEQIYVNATGNPGMATGGSGDVLTGLLAALAAQRLALLEAAVLGVYVHGLAGDLAAVQLGQTALVASDLLSYLPDALRMVEARGGVGNQAPPRASTI